MSSTPARSLRSAGNTSTPVSTNTSSTGVATGTGTRGRGSSRRTRVEQPIVEESTDNDEEEEDDDDDESMLQTQLPVLPSRREGKNQKNDQNDNDDIEENDDDFDLKALSKRKQRSPDVQKTKRTARKTVSGSKTRTRKISASDENCREDLKEDEEEDAKEAEDEEEDPKEAEDDEEDIALQPVKPEVDENVVAINGDPKTFAKKRIHQYFYDLLDQEQHIVLFTRSSRISNWPVLQHFWNKYPFNQYEYGRLYVRTRLCSLLVDAVSEPAYSETSLVAWDTTDWNDFIEDFRVTKDSCLNPNCSHVFGTEDDDGEELANHKGPTIPEIDRTERLKKSQHLELSRNFTQKYPIIEKTCQMNMLLAPIRQVLEEQIRSGATGPPKGILDKDVKLLYSAAGSSDSFVVRKHLFRLFVPADDTDPTETAGDDEDNEDDEGTPPQCILKNLEDMKEVLRTKPLDLNWLQGRVDRIVWLWNEDCFGMKQPFLELLSYHDTALRNHYNRAPLSRRMHLDQVMASTDPQTPPPREKGERTGILETLKRRRIALNKNHGDDPLIESRKLAAATTKGTTRPVNDVPATNILYKGKKSNIVVQFDDSDEEEAVRRDVEDKDFVDESSERRVRLSTLPKKRRMAKSPSATEDFGSPAAASRIYNGPPPDEGIFDRNGNVLQRHPWSEEEIAALLSGLDKHGLGKWIYIKQEYGYILRNRTTVQLKDKFRNMKKNGELPDRFLTDEV